MNFKELLILAKQGDNDAMETLIAMYKPLLTRYSYINNMFDEDLHQEQLIRFIYCVQKFSIEIHNDCNENPLHKRD